MPGSSQPLRLQTGMARFARIPQLYIRKLARASSLPTLTNDSEPKPRALCDRAIENVPDNVSVTIPKPPETLRCSASGNPPNSERSTFMRPEYSLSEIPRSVHGCDIMQRIFAMAWERCLLALSRFPILYVLGFMCSGQVLTNSWRISLLSIEHQTNPGEWSFAGIVGTYSSPLNT